MLRITLLLALALSAMTMAFAQAAPGTPPPQPTGPGGNRGGGMQGMQQPSADMTITPNGVFVLKSGVLVKYDTTLKQQGTPLELFGAPLPARPTVSNPPTDTETQAMMAWMQDAAPRLSAAAMLAKGDELLIVIGSTLYRVNQKTMALDTKQAKLLPAQGNMAQNRPLAAMMTALNASKPVLQLCDNTLFIVIGSNLAAVNADTGDVLSNGMLPKETTINMPNMRGGMGGNGGGRGGRGGRGAGGGNNNAPAGAAPAPGEAGA